MRCRFELRRVFDCLLSCMLPTKNTPGECCAQLGAAKHENNRSTLLRSTDDLDNVSEDDLQRFPVDVL